MLDSRGKAIDATRRKSVEELITQLRNEFEEVKKKTNEIKFRNDLFVSLCQMLINRLDNEFDGLDDIENFDAFDAYIQSLVNTMKQYRMLFESAKKIAEIKIQIRKEESAPQRTVLATQLVQQQTEMKRIHEEFSVSSSKHIQSSFQLSGKRNSTQMYLCLGAAILGVMLLVGGGVCAACGVTLPASPVLTLLGLELLAGAVGVAFELSLFAVSLAVVGGVFAAKARQQGLSKEATQVATTIQQDAKQLVAASCA